MNLATLLKLLHVLIAFWFVAGLLARNMTMARAAQTADMHSVRTLIENAGRFERWMVIPGSLAVFLLGLLTAWAQGWPVLGFLQGGATNWVLVATVLYLSMLPLVPFLFLPRGKIFEAALHDAEAQGHVTPALTAAFKDRAVAAGHIYELVATTLVIVLMVTKPF